MGDEKNPIGRPTKYKPEFCHMVIEWGKEGASKAEMACNLGIHKDTLYEWDKTYPDFSDSLKLAVQYSQVSWEKIGKAAVSGTIPNFNAATWIFNMKNRFSEDYKDTIKQEHTGANGAPIAIIHDGIKREGD